MIPGPNSRCRMGRCDSGPSFCRGRGEGAMLRGGPPFDAAAQDLPRHRDPAVPARGRDLERGGQLDRGAHEGRARGGGRQVVADRDPVHERPDLRGLAVAVAELAGRGARFVGLRDDGGAMLGFLVRYSAVSRSASARTLVGEVVAFQARDLVQPLPNLREPEGEGLGIESLP